MRAAHTGPPTGAYLWGMRWPLGLALMSTLGVPDLSAPDPAPLANPAEELAFVRARARMVQAQLRFRGIRDERVLAALATVPRQAFVPAHLRARAYEDGPLPIGLGQTISQPYIVAFMTEALALQPGERVLEVGTGSGYQAAVLSDLVAEVWTLERVPELAERARSQLAHLHCANVRVRCGDGFLGWPEGAPFDAILVTCAPEEVPPALVAQLREGGRMILPLGPQGQAQQLCLLRKGPGGLDVQSVMLVAFVPMVPGGPEP